MRSRSKLGQPLGRQCLNLTLELPFLSDLEQARALHRSSVSGSLRDGIRSVSRTTSSFGAS